MTADSSHAVPGVVFHLDEGDPARLGLVLTNIANLLVELGDTTEIELVANGPGVAGVLVGSAHAARVEELLARGVTVVGCANSLSEQGISKDRLLRGVGVVPSGVGELVARQRERWAYLRP
jgi:intracellular sulfur oxidation DsrE/DsrF family protein